MATVVGVYTDNVSLKYFGKHSFVSTKPLWWHDTLALVKVSLIHKVAHDNMVRDMLSEQKIIQAMTIILILVANVYR